MTSPSDLSGVSTAVLRRELHAREEEERKRLWEEVSAQFPCPHCGAGPRSIESELVEEFRFAPRDPDGRPRLYAPYEQGETKGGRYERKVECVNGHVSVDEEIVWWDK